MENEQSEDIGWQTVDPFDALSEGKLTLESKIISRVYSADKRYKHQMWILGPAFSIMLMCIYLWFPLRWNGLFGIAIFTFAISMVLIGIASHKLDKHVQTGKVIFYNKHAVIMNMEGFETSRFLYSDLRSIIHDDDATIMKVPKEHEKYLDYIPLRFILQGKLRYRLELSSRMQNYTEFKIRIAYNPTLEELMMWIYPNYEVYDRKRKASKSRYLSD